MGANSFPGSDSIGIEVRAKLTEILFIQVGFETDFPCFLERYDFEVGKCSQFKLFDLLLTGLHVSRYMKGGVPPPRRVTIPAQLG